MSKNYDVNHTDLYINGVKVDNWDITIDVPRYDDIIYDEEAVANMFHDMTIEQLEYLKEAIDNILEVR